MNCARCHHSDYAHDGRGGSLTRRGGCRIPGCPCVAFKEMMHVIDEELA